MRDEAHKGGVLEILVAVLSCAWSYQMIGEHHKTIPGALEHPMYGEWVNGYSCQAYCESTQLIIDLVNKYGEGIAEEREHGIRIVIKLCRQSGWSQESTAQSISKEYDKTLDESFLLVQKYWTNL